MLTLIATPAGDGNVNGFGLEFYIETPGDEIADTIHDVEKSWQFQLLYTVSQLAAGAASACSTLRGCGLRVASCLLIYAAPIVGELKAPLLPHRPWRHQGHHGRHEAALNRG